MSSRWDDTPPRTRDLLAMLRTHPLVPDTAAGVESGDSPSLASCRGQRRTPTFHGRNHR